MSHKTDDDDNKVVAFPISAEERKALRKAEQDLEKQASLSTRRRYSIPSMMSPMPTSSLMAIVRRGQSAQCNFVSPTCAI